MAKPVNYDIVAAVFDRRYDRNRTDGIRACLHRFVASAPDLAVAEVGCGTGHWLAGLSHGGLIPPVGLDLSWEMLARAKAAAPTALLVQGRSDRLPWVDACFDRVFCVNALHHFQAHVAFMSECRRVLRPGGGLLTIGLDPHCGEDRWWVYDFFPAALEADRSRYLSTSTIRASLTAAGFHDAATEIAQRIPAELSFEEAQAQGFVDRRSTSQLMVISDDEYEVGLRRLLTEQPVLRADLRLWATTAWV